MKLTRMAPLFLLGVTLALDGCGPPDVTGMRIRLSPGIGNDIHQFVVQVRNEGGVLLHECLAPATPSAEEYEGGTETWTVLFDDELWGDMDITALGINSDGRQSARGNSSYFMGFGGFTTASVLLTSNLRDITLPPVCILAPEEALPPRVPRGTITTVDERGNVPLDTDAGGGVTDAGDAGP